MGHSRYWSGGSYVTYGGGAVPAVSYGGSTPSYTPTRVSSGPACVTCGGWTNDGCYMAYRKVVDANGQPELKCVKICDDETPGQGS